MTRVLVIPPMRSPTTERMLPWTKKHDPACIWAANRAHQFAAYTLMDEKQVPPRWATHAAAEADADVRA
jgi:hypothetical protein